MSLQGGKYFTDFTRSRFPLCFQDVVLTTNKFARRFGGANDCTYLLYFLIVSSRHFLICDGVPRVVINGEGHVKAEQVHQLDKEPRCNTTDIRQHS